jgi:ABC-type Co2+ transport system permease subunit
MAVFIAATAVLLVGQHLHIGFSELQTERRQVNLIALSDAALAETLAGLAADPSFSGVSAHPFGNGTIASTVSPAGHGLVTVVARARFAGWQGTLKAEVEVTGPRVVRWSRSQKPEAD